MSHLHIIKASAGSGKTFSLTSEFLKLVIGDPSYAYFKSVLAVTFTNKATAEMKERILKELHILGSGGRSAHLDILKEHTKKDEKNIRTKSANILQHILHGYSWFKIETIDSFFQGIIRSFLMELGIPGHFVTEIDYKKILEQAVDNFMDKLGGDKNILNWLLGTIEHRISDGKNWDIKKELFKTGENIFKEIYEENAPQLEAKLSDYSFLNAFKNEIRAIIAQFESELNEKAVKALKSIEAHGLTADDFKGKLKGPVNFFFKIKKREYKNYGNTIHKAIEDNSYWASKSSAHYNLLINIADQTLNPAAIDILNYIEKNYAAYLSAKTTIKDFQPMVLITALADEVKKAKQEKGIMLLSDSAPFINRIINNNDTPFIYEKTGNRFNHILIDEFQDTSRLQYGNFKPLISNSLSFNHNCLVVGDIKQSIYRWRNSNWEILAKNIRNDFSHAVKENSLDTNWRSNKNIVNFNNAFFGEAVKQFNTLIPLPADKYINPEILYSDVAQKAASACENKGYVRIHIFDKEETNEDNYYGNALIKDINNLLIKGFKPGDIAVLVRSRKEGATIANFIIEADKNKLFASPVSVISNESLFLKNSSAVRLLLAALRYTCDITDPIAAASLISAYKMQFSDTFGTDAAFFPEGEINRNSVDNTIYEGFTQECAHIRGSGLYLLASGLASALKLDIIEEESIYLHSFLDCIFQFDENEINDLYGFLQYWETNGENKTISAAEAEHAVRILTIHRSKGLEFPAVFVPFATWGLTPNPKSPFWVKPGSEPFSKMPLLLLSTKNELAESTFKDQYNEEVYLTLIDNLNLLYVAFTRAINTLIIYTDNPKTDAVKAGPVISSAIFNIYNTGKLNFVQTENSYQLGEPQPRLINKPAQNFILLRPAEKPGEIPQVHIKWQSAEYLREAGTNETRELGKVMHSIMEHIETTADVDISVQNALLLGMIQKSEERLVKEKITSALAMPGVNEWFSGRYSVLTENEIIGNNFSVKRPDRVMIEGDSAIIVDYKFGHGHDTRKHPGQVKQYMELIRQMGYTKVSGFLWYISDNILTEVTE
ncbi:MAG: UvrD-helicase domain-containing protein [Bacteroidales bacterium]|nr:UvrD-helicase domain-containing protein [Bacteroidales bacterium]